MQRWDTDKNVRRCQFCDSHVTPEFRRVCGDEDGIVHRCRNCDTYSRIGSGSPAGRDVTTPDPLNQPTRFAGSFEDLIGSIRATTRNISTDGGSE